MPRKRKWIRRASTQRARELRIYSQPQRARELRIYSQRRKWFLAANPWCAYWLKQNPPQHVRSTSVHHLRGRTGRLLLDERFWVGLSDWGHLWVHANIEAARKLGLLCQRGEWNTVPRIAA